MENFFVKFICAAAMGFIFAILLMIAMLTAAAILM